MHKVILTFPLSILLAIFVVVSWANISPIQASSPTHVVSQQYSSVPYYLVQDADERSTKAQAMDDQQPIEIHRINMGVSNAYLLETEEGLILIDAGLPFTDRLVLRKMKRIGRDDLKLIYITHAHIDHYGAANRLREITGAPIAIHHDDAQDMTNGQTELGTVRDWERTSDISLPFIEPLLDVQPTKPDIVLQDGDSLEPYGVDAYVLHTPGHTPGSSTLVVEDRMAFAGDLVASSNGKTRAQRSFAEDWHQVADSIARLRELDLELIYPGHGSEPIPGEDLGILRANFVEDK